MSGARGQVVRLAGGDFHCHIWGSEQAPPVLFLHGFPEWGGAWAKVARLLSDRYFCIAPDLRGYGRSWRPDGMAAYSVGAMIPDIAGLIAQFGAERPVPIVAHDWGAALAYVVAASHPQGVSRLAVLNGVHPLPFQAELAKGGAQAAASQYIRYLRRPEAAAALRADDCAKLFAFVTGVGRHPWITDGLRVAYLREWSRPGAMEAMLNWYRASTIDVPAPGEAFADGDYVPLDPARLRITMPHLVIWGEDDQALLPQTRDGVRALCDDLRVEPVPGADHWLHHQKPARVAALLDAFLSAG